MTGHTNQRQANPTGVGLMAGLLIRNLLCALVCLSLLTPELGLAGQAIPNWPLKVFTGKVTGNAQVDMVSRLIVKPRNQPGSKLESELQAHDGSELSKISSVPMSVLRRMSGGAHVIELNQPVTLSEARVLAARLMRDSNVELAEPDVILHAATVTPNDPLYVDQWHYMTPSPTDLGGVDLPNAWSITEGDPSITVAVLDTGYRPHVDLGTVLPGYDFISDIPTANDGDGRDADPRDPGDWNLANECGSGSSAYPSSWHGTHVAGTIAAILDNSIGVTGVAPNVRILPVRVLGKCGGYTSDIIDAMRWAVGIPVSGAPANPYPARIINLSLGATTTCSNAFQSAVTDVVNAGTAIMVATGNSSSTSTSEPANCVGVIAVTAHAIDGDNAWYANVGPNVAISAPGGGCGTTNSSNRACTTANSPGVYSLMNTGTQGPVADSYSAYMGTSMATPHVSGVAALMLSVDPSLTPAQIKSYLQSSARPFPAGTYCTRHPGVCGAGMLDAQQALVAVTTRPPTVTLGSIPSIVAPGDTVNLSGSAVAGSGKTIASYKWTQNPLTSPPLNIINANSANASFIAPQTGTYSLVLTATDSGGFTGSATAVIRVNSPPVLNAVSAQTVVAGQTLSFSVTATDIDGDTPIFHSVSKPAGSTLSANGLFTWSNATPAGNYSLTYYASDNYANSAQGTVKITVTGNTVVPSGGGGGGGGGSGSFDGALLAALGLLALSLRLRSRQLAKGTHK